jgi:rsbT antagonist protein RsbS
MRIPILKLGNILLTSIQSDISDEHALMLQTDILQRMDQSRARGVVLDITSLDIVDSYMARILTETARMAQLMGGEVVITGMNPMVALTLVEMGRELLGVLTALTLQQGIDKIKDRLAILEGDRGEEAPNAANG